MYSTAVQEISSDFDSDQESHGSRHMVIQWEGYISAQQKKDLACPFFQLRPLQTVRTYAWQRLKFGICVFHEPFCLKSDGKNADEKNFVNLLQQVKIEPKNSNIPRAENWPFLVAA